MKLEIDARVRRPDFELEAKISCDADAVGVVGVSGAGKSTLLDVIAGFEPGRVVVDGAELGALPPDKRRIGYVPQDSLLFPHLTVRENIAYSPDPAGVDDIARALGIDALLDRAPRTLSGGERRRAALARALAARPRLMLLDEPFAGLDEMRRREASALLAEVRRRYGVPMVLVSHVPEEVVGLTDWAVRLESGRVVGSGKSISVLRAGETQIDNHFEADVIGPNRVMAAGVELVAAVGTATGRVRLACYARDIILATEMPRGISARNCFAARIATSEPAGEAVLVGLEAPAIRALVTSEAVRTLGLAPGRDVFVILKATSISYLGEAR